MPGRCQACGGVRLDGGEIHRVIAHYRGSRNGSSSGGLELDLDPFSVFDAADLLHGVFEVWVPSSPASATSPERGAPVVAGAAVTATGRRSGAAAGDSVRRELRRVE